MVTTVSHKICEIALNSVAMYMYVRMHVHDIVCIGNL